MKAFSTGGFYGQRPSKKVCGNMREICGFRSEGTSLEESMVTEDFAFFDDSKVTSEKKLPSKHGVRHPKQVIRQCPLRMGWDLVLGGETPMI